MMHALTRQDPEVLQRKLDRLKPPKGSPPCNGCTRCCERDQILLHPENGDDPAAYECDEVTHPLTGEPAYALKHVSGRCVYLTPGKGCSIHERAPVVCRSFDCRGLVLAMSTKEQHRLIDLRMLNKAVLQRGRELLRRR